MRTVSGPMTRKGWSNATMTGPTEPLTDQSNGLEDLGGSVRSEIALAASLPGGGLDGGATCDEGGCSAGDAAEAEGGSVAAGSVGSTGIVTADDDSAGPSARMGLT